jgi:hypothetical protein
VYSAAEVELPADHAAELEPDESIWYCRRCGTIWYHRMAMHRGSGNVERLEARARTIGRFPAPEAASRRFTSLAKT